MDVATPTKNDSGSAGDACPDDAAIAEAKGDVQNQELGIQETTTISGGTFFTPYACGGTVKAAAMLVASPARNR